jgi:CRISPR/Cas system-associated exonuclease Cas4 (RecB family)
LCLATEEELAAAVRAFALAPQYEELRPAGSAPDALIEQHFVLPGFPCQVSGVIDLAYCNEAQINVVDWKLGLGAGESTDRLQLATYALWAMSYFGCTTSALRVCEVHLRTGEIATVSFDSDLLAAARLRIIQDAERMAALQELGEAGEGDAFTPCLQPAVCRSCPFERLCYA